MSPHSTNTTTCLLLIREYGQGGRADIRHHNLVAPRSEFGAGKSQFDRCSPMSCLVEHAEHVGIHARVCA